MRQLFPLRPITVAALVLPQLPRVGDHELSPTFHPVTASSSVERGLSGQRLGGQTDERRRFRAPEMRDGAETDEPVAELFRIEWRCRSARRR